MSRTAVSQVFFSFFLRADHPQLHAPLPAALPRGLRGPAQGQREVRGGELQNLRVRGDSLHGGHGLPEPPGRRPVGAELAASSEDCGVGDRRKDCISGGKERTRT